jgi:hypothetical protein
VAPSRYRLTISSSYLERYRGLRCRTIYLATVGSVISIPSLSNSPWIRGAPHSGLFRLSIRIKSRTCCGTAGRPRWPRRIFQVQKRRNPFRCQAMTVAGLTIIRADFQLPQTRRKHTQKTRSTRVSFSCFGAERRSTPSGCRKARFSSRSSAEVLNNEGKTPTTVNSCWTVNHKRKQYVINLNDYRRNGIFWRHNVKDRR